jgi:small subunit ribosomal protein S2
VGTKKQVKEKVATVAKEVGQYFVNERWLGGTLTNFDMLKRSLTKLKKMKEEKEAGGFAVYTKKERLLLDREITRLERFFGGLTGLEAKPDVLVIVDLKKEAGAAKEAKSTGVTTVGIADTNSDPDLVDYAIPMNDDATKALDYVLDLMAQAMKVSTKVSTKVPTEK